MEEPVVGPPKGSCMVVIPTFIIPLLTVLDEWVMEALSLASSHRLEKEGLKVQRFILRRFIRSNCEDKILTWEVRTGLMR